MRKIKSYKVFKSVHVGKGTVIEEGSIIGLPPSGFKNGELKTIIGKNSYIRSHTIIYAGTKIGANFQTGPCVLIRENNKIGKNVVIWHNSTLNPENVIGNDSRIHSGCFLEKVTLGEKVFLGPHVIFTDDPHPVIPIDYRECWKGADVKDGAVIGANSTILPHVKIGKHSVIGAGSVVVKDVPGYKVVVGNPAKVIKDISQVVCKKSGETHTPYSSVKRES